MGLVTLVWHVVDLNISAIILYARRRTVFGKPLPGDWISKSYGPNFVVSFLFW